MSDLYSAAEILVVAKDIVGERTITSALPPNNIYCDH